jgi:putative Mg2+ transporter-C (MgtC) family protein
MEYLSTYYPSIIPFVQITLALFFGMVLGLERVLVGRTAGPRTYGLVSIGACLATILSIDAAAYFGPAGDPFHVIAAILTGVGFIGAGLIVFRESKLSGLTTAAGIWVSAIIGIAVGFRFYSLALFTTFLTMLVFTIMWRFEKFIKDKFAEHFSQSPQDSE